jgi:hypothetical protein
MQVLDLMFENRETECLRFIGHQIITVEDLAHKELTLAGLMIAVSAAILPSLSSLPLFARWLFLLATLCVLTSALINGFLTFKISWLTTPPPDWKDGSLRLMRERALRIRDKKTAAHHRAIGFLITGIVLYFIPVLIVLLGIGKA